MPETGGDVIVMESERVRAIFEDSLEVVKDTFLMNLLIQR